ncbi:hypothetical protein LINGRAPRIM_LOCUS845 [Linum grandiflorum]
MVANAKECTDTWECKGQHRCFLDCKSQYNGTAICTPPIAPFVPYECNCVWNC